MFKHQDKRIIQLLNCCFVQSPKETLESVFIRQTVQTAFIGLSLELACRLTVHLVFLQRFEHSIKNCVFMSGTAVKVSEGHGVFLTSLRLRNSRVTLS